MPEGFGKMTWNGELILTKNFLVPYVQDDGSIKMDTNSWGEYVKFQSHATYGIFPRQPRYVLPIIFERVREELRSGKTTRNALDLGYGRAFWTIFDSHITAGMAGAVLMMYSSGPIYGFAVTLLIGIGTSMFTSIVATRLMYDYLISKGKLQHLSV